LAFEGHERRRAQFSEFLHQELGAVAFGKRRRDLDSERQLAVRRLDAFNLEQDRSALRFDNPRRIFAPVAVE
jgi:hypothetical protein